ncbi:MAG: lysophospholipid acyltransferase family protein [Planctomycetota bacterium]
MNSSDERPNHRNPVWLAIQMFCWLTFAVWFRYRVRGREHVPKEGPALFLINHQSFLDPLLVPLWFRRPVSFLARDSLFTVPIVGWVLRSTYVIPINRDSPGRSSVQASINVLKSGNLLGIFPEGTRTRDGEVGRFQSGFLMMLRRYPAPVIPVGISGAEKAMPRGSIWIRPRSIRVAVGEPIDPSKFERSRDRDVEKELIEFVRQRIIDCQEEAARM